MTLDVRISKDRSRQRWWPLTSTVYKDWDESYLSRGAAAPRWGTACIVRSFFLRMFPFADHHLAVREYHTALISTEHKDMFLDTQSPACKAGSLWKPEKVFWGTQGRIQSEVRQIFQSCLPTVWHYASHLNDVNLSCSSSVKYLWTLVGNLETLKEKKRLSQGQANPKNALDTTSCHYHHCHW